MIVWCPWDLLLYELLKKGSQQSPLGLLIGIWFNIKHWWPWSPSNNSLHCPLLHVLLFLCSTERKKKKVKLKGGWKYLNKPFYEDVNETTESTFMLFRLISVRLGSFAFILCKLASTLVGLGGSSKMGLTFSPLTTSATQELIKCWHKEQAGSVSLALQLSFRSVLKKGFTWTPELGRGALAMQPSLAPCPFEHPVTATAVAGRYHCGQFPPSGTKVPAQLEPKQLLRYRM